MADALSNFVTEVIRLFVGVGLCLGLVVFLSFLLGFRVETMGLMRCRRMHPQHGTRCALKSNGHLGIQHRDRRGRAWW